MPKLTQETATADDDLTQIERDIRTLKIEYEQYFGGGRKRPPADTQWRVDTLVRRWNERVAELTFAQRFRFNNLAQTYAKYQDVWRKKLIQKETGAVQHHFGAAAKAIEAERAREAAQQHSVASDTPRGAPRKHAAAGTFTLAFRDAEQEEEKIHTLYHKLIEARSGTGESAGAPSLQDFERFVRKKTKELRDKGGHEVEYSVAVEAGRVKLKARISG